jgi:FixJ family two-component response regulator
VQLLWFQMCSSVAGVLSLSRRESGVERRDLSFFVELDGCPSRPLKSLKGGPSMQATHVEVGSGLMPRPDPTRQVSIPPDYRQPTHSGETVYLVEGDSQAREYLSGLLKSFEIKVVSFGTRDEYLAYPRPDGPACLIAEMDPPGVKSADLQPWNCGGMNPSVVFISRHADVAATVRAIKAGAIEVLTNPVDPIALIDAARAALAENRKLRQRKAELAKLQERFSLLTPREQEVVPLIVGGLLNKQAASLLGISEVTLQIHRSRAMQKMQAESFAELVRMSMKLRIRYWREDGSGHTRRASSMREFGRAGY